MTPVELGQQMPQKVRNDVLSQIWSHAGRPARRRVDEGVFSAELQDELIEVGAWVKEQAEDDNDDPR